MAKTKNTATTATEQTAPVLVRKIGKTTYIVGIHFSQTSKETMDDKVLALSKTIFATLPCADKTPSRQDVRCS